MHMHCLVCTNNKRESRTQLQGWGDWTSGPGFLVPEQPLASQTVPVRKFKFRENIRILLGTGDLTSVHNPFSFYYKPQEQGRPAVSGCI